MMGLENLEFNVVWFMFMLAAWFVIEFKWLKILFCFVGWHSYEILPGNKRECKHCKKRQAYIRVGKHGGWK